eukprot:gb/GECH01000011.1/.p1 GENE.gb/GECH01000011.1/~~gb/GECH01000011.1/.p1  ORF type:complete len:398 (+),score=92.20 gb/GECH01000011.1/:1-1194(+)
MSTKLEKDTKTRGLYSRFFYILSQNHEYVVRAVPNVRQPQLQKLCSVCIELLSDSNSPDEVLNQRLLAYLLLVLREYFHTADPRNFLRGNDFAYKLLNAYMARIGANSVLQDVLGHPVNEVLNADESDVEPDPLAIFKKMGLEGDTSDKRKLASIPEVDSVRQDNFLRLKQFSTTFLDAMYKDPTQYPMGVRYVASYLAKLATENGMDKSSRNSIVGGFIYLRYIIPAIVGPEKVNIASPETIKPKRHTFVMISKVIQQLWTGTPFPDNDKNWHLTPLNDLIEEYLDKQSEFFEKFIDVDIGEISIENPDRTICLSINHIYFIHRLYYQHQDKLDLEDNDPLITVLQALKDPPDDVPAKKDKEITLSLSAEEIPLESESRAPALSRLFSVLKKLTKQ